MGPGPAAGGRRSSSARSKPQDVPISGAKFGIGLVSAAIATVLKHRPARQSAAADALICTIDPLSFTLRTATGIRHAATGCSGFSDATDSPAASLALRMTAPGRPHATSEKFIQWRQWPASAVSGPAYARHPGNVAVGFAADIVLEADVVALRVDEAGLPIARIVFGS